MEGAFDWLKPMIRSTELAFAVKDCACAGEAQKPATSITVASVRGVRVFVFIIGVKVSDSEFSKVL
jgi:hypothetical protein